MAALNPNAITGLGSKLDTQEIIGRFIEVEKRKVIPVEQRRDRTIEEFESWNAVKMELQKLHDVVKGLVRLDIWKAKTVESSEPNVVAAKALRKASPGKTDIAVDALAAAHQITSQGYKNPEVIVGVGKITIQVGDPEEQAPVNITIADGQSTLEGVKQAINDSDAQVEAFVIKTGNSEKPFRLLLTSQLTGKAGQLEVLVDLKQGEVDPPSYQSTFEDSAQWKGVAPEEPVMPSLKAGASTLIAEVEGTYTGEEDTTFTFTAIQGGNIHSEKGVILNWTDTNGRSGEFTLNQFNYAPGQLLELADGLQIKFSDGNVKSGDSFQVKAQSERSPLLWWLTDTERASKVEPPTPWSKQTTSGGLTIKGTYQGTEDQMLKFRVEGSGQVGGPKPIYLHYEFVETGEKGKIDVGFPFLSEAKDSNTLKSATAYDPEDGEELFNMKFNNGENNQNQLVLPYGVAIEVPPGILNDGATTSLELKTAIPEDFWWLTDRGFTGALDTTLDWQLPEEETGTPQQVSVEDGLFSLEEQFSTSKIMVSGNYLGDIDKTYTFTVQNKGTVGITQSLEINWEDEEGQTGMLEFGEDYQPGTPLEFDAGLSLALGKGELMATDSFVIHTHTPTVQIAQDATLRLGATEQGGGIEITRPTNSIDDIISGVELELLNTSEKPITITVEEDQERARETIRNFVEAYNTLNATITEVTQYDQTTNTAAPLLSDRTVQNVQNEIANTTISSVLGLPQSINMLFSIGLRIDDKGTMSLDENKLNAKMEEDFDAVAQLFRNSGKSDNNLISYLGVSDQTKISPTGYEVDITQIPKKGTLTGTPLPPLITVTDKNNELFVIADGRRSDTLQLENDVYTPITLAQAIQSRLSEDRVLGKRRIRVNVIEGNKLQLISGSYGSNSSMAIEGGKNSTMDTFGLANGKAQNGQDVNGTIDGAPAKGRGQLLMGKEKTDADGLRLFVDLTEEAQLKTGAEANVIFTKGIGAQLDEELKAMLDPVKGEVSRSTKDLSEEIKNYDTQILQLNKRVESKREELMIKFAKLDSKMGRLKAQQDYLGQQLSALSSKKREK